MFYLIPAATLVMLGFVFWRAAFRMRRDRVELTREHTRGKHALRPRERLRFLLKRSFEVAEEKPEWEEPLLSTLATIPAPGAEGERQEAGASSHSPTARVQDERVP
ncbi:MAG TPA: hypothetical protein VGB70_07385 [Allosphingosinicella sp.]|jgi:hypothetical protein